MQAQAPESEAGGHHGVDGATQPDTDPLTAHPNARKAGRVSRCLGSYGGRLLLALTVVACALSTAETDLKVTQREKQKSMRFKEALQKIRQTTQTHGTREKPEPVQGTLCSGTSQRAEASRPGAVLSSAQPSESLQEFQADFKTYTKPPRARPSSRAPVPVKTRPGWRAQHWGDELW